MTVAAALTSPACGGVWMRHSWGSPHRWDAIVAGLHRCRRCRSWQTRAGEVLAPSIDIDAWLEERGLRLERIRLVRGRPLPAGAVSVARPTRWGNPYRIGASYRLEEMPERFRGLARANGWVPAGQERLRLTRQQAVVAYRCRVNELESSEVDALLAPLEAARALACYCPEDEPCHADYLVHIELSRRGRILRLSRRPRAVS